LSSFIRKKPPPDEWVFSSLFVRVPLGKTVFFSRNLSEFLTVEPLFFFFVAIEELLSLKTQCGFSPFPPFSTRSLQFTRHTFFFWSKRLHPFLFFLLITFFSSFFQTRSPFERLAISAIFFLRGTRVPPVSCNFSFSEFGFSFRGARPSKPLFC